MDTSVVDTAPRALLLAQVDPVQHGVPPVESLSFLAQQLSARTDLKGVGVTFVVRSEPHPALAAVGFFDEQTEARLARMSAHVQSAIDRLRYVTYADAEAACDRLGQALREAVGSELLQHVHAIGVPRGGLIVLGMLSYVLNLNHNQLEGALPPEGPLLLVDDIALTGNRLHRFLQVHPSRNVVVATLFSHPELREAMVRDEPRVSAFVSAYDLEDYDQGRSDSDTHKAQWKERWTGTRYWTGQTDHICFPWSEPDIAVWNPETEALEEGLRIIPPTHCLRNAHLTVAAEDEAHRIQHQPEAAGPIKPPSDVFFGRVEESTIVANPEADVCIELQDTGAAIWHSLIAHGTEEAVVEDLLATYDIERDALAEHVARFIDELVANHLLLRGPA